MKDNTAYIIVLYFVRHTYIKKKNVARCVVRYSKGICPNPILECLVSSLAPLLLTLLPNGALGGSRKWLRYWGFFPMLKTKSDVSAPGSNCAILRCLSFT